MGNSRKYVYIDVGGRYAKVRVMLRGQEDPSITSLTDPSKIIVVGKPVLRPPRGYKVYKLRELPEALRGAVLSRLSRA
ncbi:MAG: DUF5622 domain-containing protein [Fervidicoccaceae archaeon]